MYGSHIFCKEDCLTSMNECYTWEIKKLSANANAEFILKQKLYVWSKIRLPSYKCVGFIFSIILPHTFQYHLEFFNLGCHIKGVAFGGMSIIRGVAFVGSGLNRGVLLYYILQDIRKYLIMYPGSKYDKLDLLLKFCERKVKLFLKRFGYF